MADHTRYSPPRATLAEPPGPPAKGIRVGAVLVGSLVDLGGSAGLGIALFLGVAWRLSSQGVAEGEIEDAVTAAFAAAPLYHVTLLAGLACTVAGGWVAALLARRQPVLHAGLVGGVTLVIGALLKLVPGAQAADLYEGLGYVLTIPAAALGGWLVAAPRGSRPSVS